MIIDLCSLMHIFRLRVVGEVKDDEDNDILASGMKRKRERTNYSEREMLKDFDLAIDGKYSDYGDDNQDNNSVCSEYSDAGDNSSDEKNIDGYENEDLKQIVKDVRNNNKKKKDERHKWGGGGVTQWAREDVELLLKCLQTFGYGNISWDQFFSKQTMCLSKVYKPEELR